MDQNEYLKIIATEVDFCQRLKRKAYGSIQDEFLVLEICLLIEERLIKTEDVNLQNIYTDHLSHIYNEHGAAIKNYDCLTLAECYFNMTDISRLKDASKYESIFRLGRNFYMKYMIMKDHAFVSDDYAIIKKYLFPALTYMQKAFREGVVDAKLESQLIRRYILIHMASITMRLYRWTEFQYYLNFIPDAERDSAFHILRAATIDAYIKNTHCSVSESLIHEMLLSSSLAVVDSNENEFNKSQAIVLFQEYATRYLGDKSIKDVGDLKHPFEFEQIKKNYNHSDYRNWSLQNNLALNEHSLFCNCSLAKRDNLKLRSNHTHTHKFWLHQFQLLLEQLKFDFENARNNFYLSRTDVPIHNTYITQNMVKRGNLIVSKKSRLLVESFKATYSILDRIAVSLISVFPVLKDKPMYFHDFIDYIKHKIDFRKKYYLTSFESIAFELHPSNKNSTLKDYKIWRDAIEHNFFFVIDDSIELSEVKNKYSKFKRCEFVNEKLFRSRTLHLMQLCKSSIFSLAFLLRNESCQKYFNHQDGV